MSGAVFTPPAHLPRSARYPVDLMVEAMMGPNVLWLAEALSQVMHLEAGMRVLDLGAGRALSSIFFAREFDVSVVAADLWINPTENWERIRREAVGHRVVPLKVEAHALPFAHGYFDAIVALDSYHYFGTDDLYLKYVLQFLRPGGRFGVVVPGVREELRGGAPEHLKPYWDPDFATFHSPAWWRAHWEKSEAVTVDVAGMVPEGAALWLQWSDYCVATGAGPRPDFAVLEANMLRTDAGRTLGFVQLVATKQLS